LPLLPPPHPNSVDRDELEEDDTPLWVREDDADEVDPDGRRC
jgi:hypothetical protein